MRNARTHPQAKKAEKKVAKKPEQATKILQSSTLIATDRMRGHPVSCEETAPWGARGSRKLLRNRAVRTHLCFLNAYL